MYTPSTSMAPTVAMNRRSTSESRRSSVVGWVGVAAAIRTSSSVETGLARILMDSGGLRQARCRPGVGSGATGAVPAAGERSQRVDVGRDRELIEVLSVVAQQADMEALTA